MRVPISPNEKMGTRITRCARRYRITSPWLLQYCDTMPYGTILVHSRLAPTVCT